MYTFIHVSDGATITCVHLMWDCMRIHFARRFFCLNCRPHACVCLFHFIVRYFILVGCAFGFSILLYNAYRVLSLLHASFRYWRIAIIFCILLVVDSTRYRRLLSVLKSNRAFVGSDYYETFFLFFFIPLCFSANQFHDMKRSKRAMYIRYSL